MNKLSCIQHSKFDLLHSLTNNYNQTTLLDKLIYWWQISTYTLNDDKIWFTRSLLQIAEEAKISTRSVSRYLNDFEASGYIERKNKLFKKKHLYIRITEKLLNFLSLNHEVSQTPPESISTLEDKNSLFLNQDGSIENAKMAVSIYKDKYTNCNVNNNTVSQSLIVNNLNSTSKTATSSNYPIYPIESVIGERLSIKEKNLIKGMMFNLQQQHKLSFSSPEQLFAEIVFNVLNKEQLKGIEGFNYRINIVSKLLRTKNWKTPKGFYNHSDFGEHFRKEPTIGIKQKTLNQSTLQLKQQKNTVVKKFTENRQLIDSDVRILKESILNLSKPTGSIRLVNSVAKSLTHLQQEQLNLFKDIKSLTHKIQLSTFIPEHKNQEENNNVLSLLKHLEIQTQFVATETLEACYEASKRDLCSEQITITYGHYDNFSKILIEIEQLINKLEEYSDYEKAA